MFTLKNYVRCFRILQFLVFTTVVSTNVVSGQERIRNLAPIQGTEQGVSGFTYCGPGDELPKTFQLESAPEYLLRAQIAFLKHHEITPRELESVSTIKSLRSLRMGEFPDPVALTNEAIEKIGNMKSLEHLSTHISTSEKLRWAFLRNLRSLQSLDATGNLTFEQGDVDSIGKLTSLNTLRLGGQFECDDFEWLGNMDGLQSIGIEGKKLDPKLVKSIRKMEGLTDLSLVGISLSEKDVEQVANGSGNTLTLLDVSFSEARSVELLGKIPKLEHVAISFTKKERCSLSFVQKLRSLKTLCLRGCEISEIEFAKLKEHPSLTAIVFTDANVGRDAIEVCASIGTLNSVQLTKNGTNKIQDAILESLKRRNEISGAR